MKQCTRCDEAKPLSQFYKRKDSPDEYQYRCKECHRLEQREFRERNPGYDSRYYAANPRKIIARSTLNRAIRQGKLPRVADCVCSQCSQPAHEYYIKDYAKPLETLPVCRSCRRRMEKEQKGQAR